MDIGMALVSIRIDDDVIARLQALSEKHAIRGRGPAPYQLLLKAMVMQGIADAEATGKVPLAALGAHKLVDRLMGALPFVTAGSSAVYVLMSEGERPLVKIGVSAELRRRLGKHLIASPVELKLLLAYDGDRAEEKRVHRLFRSDRVKGEWFRASPAILSWVDQKRTELNEGVRPTVGGVHLPNVYPSKDLSDEELVTIFRTPTQK
jgi:hypothetical protein